ncbi:MAG: thiol-disulfide oxidoreductase DCC family protein [Pseudomonadales bacterium]|jgi:predicted DCC family thiol-disulfide oxidoreductase YuxK
MTSIAPVKPIIFYDGSCPLCSKEINHYQRIDYQQRVEWLDLTTNTDRLETYGIQYTTAMARLHGVDSTGEKVSGVDAFLLIWDHLDYYHYLAKVIRVLMLQKPLEFVYQRFANWRFKRRSADQCKGSCRIPPSSLK